MQSYKAKISLYWNLNNVVKYSFARCEKLDIALLRQLNFPR